MKIHVALLAAAAAVCADAAEESATNEVADLGTVVVEGSALSRYRPEKVSGATFTDMPPGTGDVPLTVFQSIPVDGVVVVSSPQDLVEMIVSKSVKMAGMMHKPVLGLVENMSYLKCPDCGREISVFGESRAESLAKKFSIPLSVRLPIDPSFAAAIDVGAAENIELPAFDDFAKKVWG